MPFPIIRQFVIGNLEIGVRCEKSMTPDHRTIISCVASYENFSYEEKLTFPHGNKGYSQEQAQEDFDAHIAKVANALAGRVVSHNVSENLK